VSPGQIGAMCQLSPCHFYQYNLFLAKNANMGGAKVFFNLTSICFEEI
jgi:hypothetical protein